MAGNTNILIKRSAVTATPGSLLEGELAYSYSSNSLFIGAADGTPLNIGGGSVLIKLQSAYDAANTALNGGSSDDVARAHANASYLQANTARTIAESAYNEANNAYGYAGTVDTYAQSGFAHANSSYDAANVAFAEAQAAFDAANNVVSSFTINGDSGTDTFSTGEILTFSGSQGIVTTVTDNQVDISVNDTILRSNTPITLQTVDGSLQVSGNLIVNGTTTTVDAVTLTVDDPLIYLAANNYSSDVVDIGFAANYYDGSTQRHTGVFRNAGTQEFYVFDGYDKEPDNNTIDVGDASFHLATLNANITAPYISVTQLDITSANVSGDIGIAGNEYLLGSAYISGNTVVTGFTQAESYKFNSGTESIGTDGTNLQLNAGSGALAGVQITGNGYLLGPNGARNIALNYNGNGGLVGLFQAQVYDTTDSNSITTGALVVDGGVGIAKHLFVGESVKVDKQLYVNNLTYTATQDATYDGIAFYNASTKEIRYSYTLDGGSF